MTCKGLIAYSYENLGLDTSASPLAHTTQQVTKADGKGDRWPFSITIDRQQQEGDDNNRGSGMLRLNQEIGFTVQISKSTGRLAGSGSTSASTPRDEARVLYLRLFLPPFVTFHRLIHQTNGKRDSNCSSLNSSLFTTTDQIDERTETLRLEDDGVNGMGDETEEKKQTEFQDQQKGTKDTTSSTSSSLQPNDHDASSPSDQSETDEHQQETSVPQEASLVSLVADSETKKAKNSAIDLRVTFTLFLALELFCC